MYQDLGLSTELDAYQRALKTSVGFNLFRVFKGRLQWSPVTSNNLALFYGPDIEQRDAFMTEIVKQVRKVKKSAHVYLADADGGLRVVSNGLKTVGGSSYTDTGFEGLTGAIVAGLALYRDEVRTATNNARLIEITNRKLTFIFLHLSKEAIEEINNNRDTMLALKDLIENSSQERLYIIPIAESASTFPEEILKILQCSVFLGKDNAKFCQQLYPNKSEGRYSIRQTVAGVVYSHLHDELVMIHPMKFTSSAWHAERTRQLKEEDKAFKKYLETLDDGRMS